MSQTKVGTRVGAISSADSDQVNLLGYGVYQGDLVSPLGFPNPCILLDNGATVWGYQCWWGSEEEVKASIGHRKVVKVTS